MSPLHKILMAEIRWDGSGANKKVTLTIQGEISLKGSNEPLLRMTRNSTLLPVLISMNYLPACMIKTTDYSINTDKLGDRAVDSLRNQ